MSRSKIIAIANQKGGVGKTTTTFNLGVALARNGKKVLLVDMDPQSNLTAYAGFYEADKLPMTLTNLISQAIDDKEITTKECILSHKENIDIIPSSLNLFMLENAILVSDGGDYILRRCLDSVRDSYDYILLDCQPSLGPLTKNALACANSIIIPVQCQYFATKGMTELLKSISKTKRFGVNPNLKIDGAVLTLVDKRTNLPKEIESKIRENYGNIVKLYNTQIPLAVRTAESTSSGGSIFSYDKNNKVAEAYSTLAKEVLEDGKNHTKECTTRSR